MATSLLDLPDEIITMMLRAIYPPYEAFPLATVCRRLNRVVIDVFLSYCHVSLPSKRLSIGSPFYDFTSSLDVLPALAMCFSAVGMSIDRLACCFIMGTVKDINMLNTFLMRLSALKKFMVDLPLPSSDADSDMTEDRLRFEAAVQCLLNTAISKGCTDLTVTRSRSRGYFACPATEPYVKPSLRDRLKRMFVTRKSSRPVSVHHSLCSLHIHTFIPYLTSFYTQTLNGSCITHLTLDSFFDQDSKSLLAEVTMPQLTHFTILNGYPGHRCLEKFLRRHPTVIMFEFLPGSHLYSIKPNLWKAMSRLTTFKCDPLHGQVFLEPQRSLPKLKKLSINPLHQSYASYFEYERIFQALARRSRSLTLTLRFLQSHFTRDWLLGCSNEDRAERSLHCVRHLKILGPANSCLGDALSVLPLWFSTFPSLQHVFIGHSLIRSIVESRLREFIEDVKVKCPRLETLSVQHPDQIDKPQVHRFSK